MSSPFATTGNRSRYSEEEWQVRVDLAAAYRLAELFGYSYLVYNHITARVPGTEHFLINRFGLGYGEITASNLITLDLDGNVVDGPKDLNFAGFVIHSAIHAARHDINCIMHTHTLYGLTVSALEEGFIPLTQDGMAFHNRIAYHEYEGLAVDTDERQRLVEDLGTHNTMILRNHGLLTAGKTVAETFVRMHNLERCCQVQVQALSTGRPLHLAPPEICELTAKQLVEYQGDEWPALLRLLDQKDPSYRS